MNLPSSERQTDYDSKEKDRLSLTSVILSYTALTLMAWAWAAFSNSSITAHSPEHSLIKVFAVGTSTGLAVLVLWEWASRIFPSLQALWHMLKDMLGNRSLWSVFLMALFSSVGEELFFRGVMQAHLGIAITSVLFGLLHGLPGTRFASWGACAIFAGLIFGFLHELSGGVLAPILAHFSINFVNLYRLTRA